MNGGSLRDHDRCELAFVRSGFGSKQSRLESRLLSPRMQSRVQSAGSQPRNKSGRKPASKRCGVPHTIQRANAVRPRRSSGGRIRARVWPCGICGVQCGTSVSPANNSTLIAICHRQNSGRRAWSPHPAVKQNMVAGEDRGAEVAGGRPAQEGEPKACFEKRSAWRHAMTPLACVRRLPCATCRRVDEGREPLICRKQKNNVSGE
jgi:hypothetical protein